MSDAIISLCGTYRYTLHRRIPQVLRWIKPCLFIMFNPSTADAQRDDPTIRRCVGFARAWGCTSLTVVNLFAYRATDPQQLVEARRHGADIIGCENDRHIREQIEAHSLGRVIAAWGANSLAPQRARQIAPLLQTVEALAVTADGQPRHPLYLRADLEPQPWSAAA